MFMFINILGVLKEITGLAWMTEVLKEVGIVYLLVFLM